MGLTVAYGIFVVQRFLQMPLLKQWDLEAIQTALTGPLPEDATDIEFPSGENRIDIRFRASPQAAMEFVSRFCYSILYECYDPFNAQDDGDVLQGHLVQNSLTAYYFSYSVNTPTVWGNRCIDLQHGLHQISVDKSDAEAYEVRFNAPGACNNAMTPFRCEGDFIAFERQVPLSVNLAQQIGVEYTRGASWAVSLDAAKRYEVIVTSPDADDSGVPEYARLWVNGEDLYQRDRCPNCQLETGGDLRTNPLRIYFPSPADGNATIFLVGLGGSCACSIELRALADAD